MVCSSEDWSSGEPPGVCTTGVTVSNQRESIQYYTLKYFYIIQYPCYYILVYHRYLANKCTSVTQLNRKDNCQCAISCIYCVSCVHFHSEHFCKTQESYHEHITERLQHVHSIPTAWVRIRVVHVYHVSTPVLVTVKYPIL